MYPKHEDVSAEIASTQSRIELASSIIPTLDESSIPAFKATLDSLTGRLRELKDQQAQGSEPRWVMGDKRIRELWLEADESEKTRILDKHKVKARLYTDSKSSYGISMLISMGD